MKYEFIINDKFGNTCRLSGKSLSEDERKCLPKLESGEYECFLIQPTGNLDIFKIAICAMIYIPDLVLYENTHVEMFYVERKIKHNEIGIFLNVITDNFFQPARRPIQNEI